MKLSKEAKKKLLSIAKGAAIAAGGAALTALAQFLSGQDFGAYTPFVAAFASFLLNVAKVVRGL